MVAGGKALGGSICRKTRLPHQLMIQHALCPRLIDVSGNCRLCLDLAPITLIHTNWRPSVVVILRNPRKLAPLRRPAKAKKQSGPSAFYCLIATFSLKCRRQEADEYMVTRFAEASG